MDQLDSNSSAENVKIISELVEVKQWETIVGGIKTLKDENETLKEQIHKDNDMVMMLSSNIDGLKDENKKLKDEIEILKYAMDTVEEYLHGRGAMTKGFMEAVKTKAEQSNSIFFNS